MIEIRIAVLDDGYAVVFFRDDKRLPGMRTFRDLDTMLKEIDCCLIEILKPHNNPIQKDAK